MPNCCADIVIVGAVLITMPAKVYAQLVVVCQPWANESSRNLGRDACHQANVTNAILLTQGTNLDFVIDGLGAQVEDVVGLRAQIVPTPLPTALPLFAIGLGVLGLIGWRRKWNGEGKRAK